MKNIHTHTCISQDLRWSSLYRELRGKKGGGGKKGGKKKRETEREERGGEEKRERERLQSKIKQAIPSQLCAHPSRPRALQA